MSKKLSKFLPLCSCFVLWLTLLSQPSNGFVTKPNWMKTSMMSQELQRSSSSLSTCLFAIGILAKKAKRAALREYLKNQQGGMDEEVMEIYKIMKAKMNDKLNDKEQHKTMGPFQQAITKRKGTLSVIAEYKRKLNPVVEVEGNGDVIGQTTDDNKNNADLSTSSSRRQTPSIHDQFVPETLGPMFRQYGAAAVSVAVDERGMKRGDGPQQQQQQRPMTVNAFDTLYNDLQSFVIEQERAKSQVPGPIPVINNDLIVDEIQIAWTRRYRCAALVLQYDTIGGKRQTTTTTRTTTTTSNEKNEDDIINQDDQDGNNDDDDEFQILFKAAQALELEVVVAISNLEDGKAALDAGAQMIWITKLEPMQEKIDLLKQLQEYVATSTATNNDNNSNNYNNDTATAPTTTTTTTTTTVSWIAQVAARNDNQLQEIEEAWALRDAGFHAVWVGDVLYKSGTTDSIETPGAIIKTMRSKSSLQWASPKVSSGRGEGAREYLGDILM